MSLFLVLALLTASFTTHAKYVNASGDPLLLTPGPLSTSLTVKQAMLHDYGSRDTNFSKMNREVLERILSLINGTETHAIVPIQGGGTFAVESMLQTVLPNSGCLLILANGAYGRRMATICERTSKRYIKIECPENEPVNVDMLRSYLAEHPEVTHVAVVYCETTTGLLNPIQEIADVVAKANRKLLIDAISAFGALPLDAAITPFDAVTVTANKGLQCVPGCAFCVIRKTTLEQCEGNAPSLCLDLYDQWKVMEKTGQWRFTPPIQVLAALHTSLQELEQEGGIPVRLQRYITNRDMLIQRMKELGFKLYLSEELQTPIIVTFLTPNHPIFDFNNFYDRLKEKGFIIYPGKLTQVDTFRIGCIGDLYPEQMEKALDAIEEVLTDLKITKEELA